MSRQIGLDKTIKAIISSIENAQEDYRSWSGGDWLWTAPEYLLTTYIARSIWSIDGSKMVTLEHNTKGVMVDGGAITRGRIPKKARPDGRVDIILWRANGEPRGVIEVKNQVRAYSVISDDVERIDKILHKNNDISSFQFGCIAFYTSSKTDKKGAAYEKIVKTFESIKKSAVAKESDTVKVKLHNSKIHQEEDSAWAAACLIFKKCALK